MPRACRHFCGCACKQPHARLRRDVVQVRPPSKQRLGCVCLCVSVSVSVCVSVCFGTRQKTSVMWRVERYTLCCLVFSPSSLFPCVAAAHHVADPRGADKSDTAASGARDQSRRPEEPNQSHLRVSLDGPDYEKEPLHTLVLIDDTREMIEAYHRTMRGLVTDRRARTKVVIIDLSLPQEEFLDRSHGVTGQIPRENH